MKRVRVFSTVVLLLSGSLTLSAQAPPPPPPPPQTIDGISTKDLKTPVPPQEKSASKAKKKKSFEPPREGPKGIPGVPGMLEGPPPARQFALNQWKETAFPASQFAVSFPTKPNEDTQTNASTQTVTTLYEVITADGTYSVAAINLPRRSAETKDQIKARLRGMLKQLETGPYKWLGGKEIEMDDFPGIEFKYQTPLMISWQRFLVVDSFMYRVIAETIPRTPELKEPQLFLDSFKLLPQGKVAAETAPPPPPPPAPGQGFGETPRPTTQRVSSGVLQELAIKKVLPSIPPNLQGHVKGAVLVAITISETGQVEKADLVSGHPLLQEACLAAAKQWEFKPTLLGNKPIKVQGVLPFNFQ